MVSEYPEYIISDKKQTITQVFPYMLDEDIERGAIFKLNGDRDDYMMEDWRVANHDDCDPPRD